MVGSPQASTPRLPAGEGPLRGRRIGPRHIRARHPNGSGPTVTEDVTHRPHPRATSRDTAHSGRLRRTSLTPQETTTTYGPGARTSNPRVAGSTPARRTNNDTTSRVAHVTCRAARSR